jgi:Asp-tRNA(Asn)/Glu-tRNA(Gln) amidotransferase A subunit family amidase
VYASDLPAAARAIRSGLTSSRALVEACLSAYDEREPTVRAFAWLDRDRALRLADAADAAVRREGASLGALHGVPVGVKDIFDTAGIPTENGSRLYAGRVPGRSAAAVEALEEAGAFVIGKTVTTELAYFHPGPTRNPHDPARTPGGSSMGSAAAVASGMVPGAIGSQTNGSVIRPAAFCGVVGVKPTYGRLSLERVMPFAPTLDHVGTFATTVEGAAMLCAAIARAPLADWWEGPAATPRLAAIRTKDWERASEPMRERFQRAVDALASAGRAIEWPALPPALDDAVPVLRRIMARESVGTIGAAIARDPSKASEVAKALVAEGEATPDAAYREALADRDRLVALLDTWASPYDAVLTLATTGEAPTPETTGDPVFCSRWSLTGAPAVTIPIGRGPSGLPLGLQLIGAPGEDKRVLATAAWAEKVLSGW